MSLLRWLVVVVIVVVVVDVVADVVVVVMPERGQRQFRTWKKSINLQNCCSAGAPLIKSTEAKVDTHQ